MSLHRLTVYSSMPASRAAESERAKVNDRRRRLMREMSWSPGLSAVELHRRAFEGRYGVGTTLRDLDMMLVRGEADCRDGRWYLLVPPPAIRGWVEPAPEPVPEPPGLEPNVPSHVVDARTAALTGHRRTIVEMVRAAPGRISLVDIADRLGKTRKSVALYAADARKAGALAPSRAVALLAVPPIKSAGHVSDETFAAVVEQLQTPKPASEIAAAVGCATDSVSRVVSALRKRKAAGAHDALWPADYIFRLQ